LGCRSWTGELLFGSPTLIENIILKSFTVKRLIRIGLTVKINVSELQAINKIIDITVM